MSQPNTKILTTAGLARDILPLTGQPVLLPYIRPDGTFENEVYKVEQVIFRSASRGARLHLWLMPDPRMHNHPWEWIDCRILKGKYTAEEIKMSPGADEDGVMTPTSKLRKVILDEDTPRSHIVEYDTYHRVVKVEPGTVSLMEFGPEVGDGKQWHNAEQDDAGTWRRTKTTPPIFLGALRHLNPRLRPADWKDPFAHFSIPTIEELLGKA